ncbi:MAG: signal peptidase II [Erysipelotrichaceae bacterium]|nr:signal peptidase II [Erysipelotrichaceae bacterium]
MTQNKVKYRLKQLFHSYYWVLFLVLILDIISKALAHTLLTEQVVIIPNFFSFNLYYNTGAAWSFMSDQTVILMLISLVATGAFLFARIYYRNKIDIHYKIIAALVIAGTAGNLIDRTLTVAGVLDGVIDFIRFDFGNYTFPIFNIADASLVIGAIYLFIILLFTPDKKKEEHEENESNNGEEVNPPLEEKEQEK